MYKSVLYPKIIYQVNILLHFKSKGNIFYQNLSKSKLSSIVYMILMEA